MSRQDLIPGLDEWTLRRACRDSCEPECLTRRGPVRSADYRPRPLEGLLGVMRWAAPRCGAAAVPPSGLISVTRDRRSRHGPNRPRVAGPGAGVRRRGCRPRRQSSSPRAGARAHPTTGATQRRLGPPARRRPGHRWPKTGRPCPGGCRAAPAGGRAFHILRRVCARNGHCHGVKLEGSARPPRPGGSCARSQPAGTRTPWRTRGSRARSARSRTTTRTRCRGRTRRPPKARPSSMRGVHRARTGRARPATAPGPSDHDAAEHRVDQGDVGPCLSAEQADALAVGVDEQREALARQFRSQHDDASEHRHRQACEAQPGHPEGPRR